MEINNIICGDSLDILKELPDCSVHCIITSPPYFTGMPYNEGGTKYSGKNTIQEWNKYLKFLYDIFDQCCRVLVSGGNFYINIDNSHTSMKGFGRNLTLHTTQSLVCEITKSKYGLDYRGNFYWSKRRRHGTSGGAVMMMGSFGRHGSPGSIPIYDMVEDIITFKKQGKRKDVTDELRKASSLTKDEFRKFNMQIWNDVHPVTGKARIHPCPFPVELPHRLIKIGSYINDIILDPFCGSGTTCVAAKQLGRNYIGIDLEQKFCDIAVERLKNTIQS